MLKNSPEIMSIPAIPLRAFGILLTLATLFTPAMRAQTQTGAGVKVSGRVIRLPTAGTPAPPRISITERSRPTGVERTIASDGTFEFSGVVPGQYIISLSPVPEAAMFVYVVVPPAGLQGLEIVVPAHRVVTGRVETEDDAPAPLFGVFLQAVAGETFRPNPVTPGLDILLPVAVLADGTLRTQLPLGEYRLHLAEAPPGYRPLEVRYGDTDLSKETLKITAAGAERLYLKFGVQSPMPWVRVGGRVVTPGNEPAMHVDFIMLSGRVSLEAKVNSDGSFNFPRVLPGSYSARTVPFGFGAPPTTVVIANEDLVALEIPAPREVRISGRVMVEGGAPLPRFSMELTGVEPGPPGRLSLGTRPPIERDGAFRTLAGEGLYRMRIDGYPASYRLKTLTYGSIDLTKEPFPATPDDSRQLHVTFETVSGAQWTKVSGRVLNPPKTEPGNPARVVISGPVLAETGIGADGTFVARVPPGAYVAWVVPGAQVASAQNIDVKGNEVQADLTVRRQVEGIVRVVMDNAGALPDLSQAIVAAVRSNGISRSSIRPDGTFLLVMAEGEQRIEVANLPAGYKVKAINLGPTSLLGQPLRFEGPEIPSIVDILVTLQSNPFPEK
jgi:hypothetical protein